MTSKPFNPEDLPQQIPDDATDVVQDFIPGAWSEVEEVMREVFARLPYGEPITLSNGREFHLKKFIEPRQDQSGRWMFAFDATFPEAGPGAIDHLEFSVRHSGGGGALVSPGIVEKADND